MIFLKIGFIGTGVMGTSMARKLCEGGHEVTLYNRTLDKAIKTSEDLKCKVSKDLRSCVVDQDVIITIIGYPKDVEEVYFSEDGIINNAKEGTYIIDMTTSSPKLAKKIGEESEKHKLKALDAPVSGGDKGAREGTLSIMVGGKEEDFKEMFNLLSLMGKSVNHMGSYGYGQHTKAANQIIVAGNTSAYTEALVYSKAVGLDPHKMLNAVSGGAAGSWQVNNMAPRALKGDLDPGFFIKHFIKDMNIIVEETKERGIDLEVLEKVLSLYNSMKENNMENLGTQALIKYYEGKNN